MTLDDTGVPNGAPSINGSSGSNDPNIYHGNQDTSLPPIPVAVVGMACRFAGGATSPEKLWDLCASSRDAWSPIPESRFDVKSLYDANREKPGRNHATGGYFLQDDVALFDAAFFNFTSDAASAMDPQLRLLLEIVYEATEDAGLPIEKLAGPGPSTSVFTGCYTKDYHDLQTRDPESMPPSTLTGNYTAMFSNRVSHFYDFQGASMSIDTGCSAALAALHQGCQTIRSGDSDVSIIGASNTILNPDIYIAMSSLGMVGADGRCYAWDSRAQGYGRGEGVAVLVLKSLDAALRDGDRVHTVIRNSGLNQDGKTTTITSPSMNAQIRLIRDCYQRAGLDLSETGYVEAHMTGTQAGDAIEAESLARTFGMSRGVDDPVWIGSVKTNVGHTEGVSGLAGIIKTAMAMKYRSIAPNLNYAIGSVKIPLKDWHLQVPTSLVPWPRDKPLRASINNFGYGGTNAHVILESALEYSIRNGNGHYSNDAAAAAATDDDDVSRLYILSAQDSATTTTIARNLAVYLRQRIKAKTAPSPSDLAFTLAERRSRLSWVAVVRARNLVKLADQLEKGPAIKVTYAPNSKQPPRLGFVFNGQGAQWHAMGRELLYVYPIFAAAVDEADMILRGYGADWSLREELMRDAQSTRVSEIHLGQPITVALQVCLVLLLRSWGIHPSAVTSHSSGEIAAAYAVGALSMKQALGVTYWRGELARTLLDHQSSGVIGGMVAGGVGPAEAEKYVTRTSSGGRVVVACVNSPESVTFSGDLHLLDKVLAQLEADSRFARKLKVGIAYHSHHMMHMASAYTTKLRDIVPSKPIWSGRVAYTSPVTGGIITSSDALTPEHYVRNLTSPVLFSQAFESMCFGPDGMSPAQVDAIVEIGPHGALAGPIRQILRGRKMAYVSCLTRLVNAVETMQDLSSELLRLGYPIPLEAVNHYANVSNKSERTTMNLVHDLPTYPWNHTKRYWVESRVNKDIRYKKFPPHELLGVPLSGAIMPAWRNFLRLSDIPWVGDHRVDGVVVLPGAAYMSMAIQAVHLVTDSSEQDRYGYRVRDIEFRSALVIPESPLGGGGVETHLRLQPCHRDDDVGWYEFDVRSLGANNVWVENCRGLVSVVINVKDVDDAVIPDAESFLSSQTEGTKVRHMEGMALRHHVAEMGIEYGPAFQGLTDSRVSTAKNRAATNLRISGIESLEPDRSDAVTTVEQPWASTSYVIHPTTLDCIIQATYTNLPPGTGQKSMVLPRSIQGMFVPRSLKRKAGEYLVVFSDLHNAQRKGFTSNVSVINAQADGDDTALLAIDRLFCQAIPRAIESGPEILLCESRWEPDILHAIPAPVKDSMRIRLGDEEIELEKKMVRASYHLISDAVTVLEGQKSEGWTPHHRALSAWMKSVVARGKSGQLAPGSKVWPRASKGVKQMLFDELKAAGTHGGLLVRVGHKLAEIVRGKTTSAELMKHDEESDLRYQYYRTLPGLQARSYKHLAKLAQLFAIKNPGAKVLEINAGSGGAARVVLEAFGHRDDSGSLIGQYIFTDVSSNLFEAAKKKLASWATVLEFRELDIDKEDPTMSTNLTAQSMDLIVASMVLHTTRDLQQTLGHMRKLLKPGGKLLLVEPMQDRLDTQLVLGTLPGWEDKKEEPGHAAKVQAWDERLRANGFTGVEFDISDCEQLQYRRSSVIFTSAAAPQEKELKGPSSVSVSVSIIVHSGSASSVSQQRWITPLTQAIWAKTGITAAVETLDDVRPDENKACILATDVMDGETVLDSLDGPTFDKLRQVLLGSRGILWLTSGGGAVNAPAPASAQVQGLLRTLRQEDASKSYVLLDLPQNWAEEPVTAVGHCIQVLQQTLLAQEVDFIDWEYAVKDSMLHVPRVYPIHEDSNNEPEQLQSFQQPGWALVWEASALGEAHWVEDVRSTADHVPDELVEIETQIFSLDHHHNLGNAFGGDQEEIPAVYEVAGVVRRLGYHTEASGLRVGDRVCGVAKGPFASTARAVWTNVAKIPDSLSLEDATCIPLAYAAAYHALVHVARVQKGDKVLMIHRVGDPNGQAVLTLASNIGANVLFATINDTLAETQKQLLLDKYHSPPRHFLANPGTRSFAEAIMAQTNDKGVDVMIVTSTSSLSVLQLQSALENIARFGRFVKIGAPDKNLDMTLLAARCASYARVDVLQLAEYNGPLMKEALEASLRIMCQDFSTKPPVSPVTRFPISQLDRALQHVLQLQQQQEGHLGKVLVIPQAGDLVKVISHARPFSLDDKKATYLIVGGVSGIGGAIASWMVSKGAKNLLVVSRNVKAHPETASLAQNAAEKGCHLRFLNCDVSSEESLVSLLHEVSASLPPIRGVVHAAAVLEDTVLERMTFAQWQRAVQPKIAGTRNLHKHLPSDLSFFVLLSSITGVTGHLSQANYAAANTFQDALARYRTAVGLPAVSIDLPVVTGAGMVTDDSNARHRVEALGTVSISITCVLDLIQAAIERDVNPQRARFSKAKTPDGAQVIVGLVPWSHLPPDATVRRDRRFGTLRLVGTASSSVSASSAEATTLDPTALLVQALSNNSSSSKRNSGPTRETKYKVAEALAARLAAIFNVPVESVDLGVAVAAHGVDSLVAVELRNWLASAGKAKLSIFDIQQSPSLSEFAGLVMERSALCN